MRGKFPRPTHHVDGLALFAKRLEVGNFQFPDVRFVDGKYVPVEIERADLMMLLEGIDSDSVKRLKRYRRGDNATMARRQSAG